MSLLATIVLAGLLNPSHVECHLWKRYKDRDGQRVCVYRYSKGFGGVGLHYPTLSFSECPRVYQCVYQKKDKRPTLNEILDGLREGFE